LEVGLDYPEHLHDAYNDKPMAPETTIVPDAWMSDYQRNLVSEFGGKFTECRKLVPNLRTKERYIVRYRNLTLYHSLGMQVSKIHRALKFKQKAWLQLNTDVSK